MAFRGCSRGAFGKTGASSSLSLSHFQHPFLRMVPCKLCGYQGSSDKASQQCPVCGEAYDDGPQDGNAAQAAGGLWAQPRSRIGALNGCNSSSNGEGPRPHVNLDLQSLLNLIPEQQDRRKRAEEAVRAASASGGNSPVRADGGHCDPDAVYIQPRVDPTMRVLKVRTRPWPLLCMSCVCTLC